MEKTRTNIHHDRRINRAVVDHLINKAVDLLHMTVARGASWNESDLSTAAIATRMHLGRMNAIRSNHPTGMEMVPAVQDPSLTRMELVLVQDHRSLTGWEMVPVQDNRSLTRMELVPVQDDRSLTWMEFLHLHTDLRFVRELTCHHCCATITICRHSVPSEKGHRILVRTRRTDHRDMTPQTDSDPRPIISLHVVREAAACHRRAIKDLPTIHRREEHRHHPRPMVDRCRCYHRTTVPPIERRTR